MRKLAGWIRCQNFSQLRTFLHLQLAATGVQRRCHPAHSGGDFLQETLDASQVRKPRLFESVSRLDRGKLFLLDRDTAPVASGVASTNSRKRSGRQIERDWLCDGCSSLLTTFDRGRGMITVPLAARKTPAHPLHLRQLQPAKTYRAELKGAL